MDSDGWEISLSRASRRIFTKARRMSIQEHEPLQGPPTARDGVASSGVQQPLHGPPLVGDGAVPTGVQQQQQRLHTLPQHRRQRRQLHPRYYQQHQQHHVVPPAATVALPATTPVITPAATSVTLAASSSIAPSVFSSFAPHLRTVVSADGVIKPLMPLTLYDHYFYPPSAKNPLDADSGYVFVLHDDYIPLDVSSPSTSLSSPAHLDNDDETDWDDMPIWEPQGGPLLLDLELSDADDPLVESAGENSELVNPAVSSTSEEVDEVNLRSGKVLPPRLTAQEKGKQVVGPSEHVGPSHDVPPVETHTANPSQVDYNILAHLRKLPSRLSIYDALVLSKEMRESLVKALLDPEICLAQLASTSSTDREPSVPAEVPRITFTKADLLLGTTAHNRPLYISADFDRYRVTRMLVDPGASVSIMTLTTLILLRIDISRLEADRMVLKGFNEASERALGSITLAFEIDGWVTEAKFHIIDAETSFNVLLGRPWIHENHIVPSSLHQCLKFLRGDVEYCIQGDLKPFSVHEVGIYEDASFYLPKNTTIPLSENRKEKEKEKEKRKDKEKENEKERKRERENSHGQDDDCVIKYRSDLLSQFWEEAESSQPPRGRVRPPSQRGRRGGRVAYVPPARGVALPNASPAPVYLDLESDSEDELYIDISFATPLPLPPPIPSDDESKEPKHTIRNLSSIDIVEETNGLVSELTLTPITDTSIGELVVKSAPILGGYSRPQHFYLGASSSVHENDAELEDEDHLQMMELPFADYSPCVQSLVKQNKISNVWPKYKADYFNNLWNQVAKPSHSRAGIGFGTVGPIDDSDYCLQIMLNFMRRYI